MLILTEKPSVSQAFAAALGVPRKGSCYENESHCIVNALGHLLENFSPEDYDPALKKWTYEALPIVPEPFRYKPIESTKNQLEAVKECFSRHKNDTLLLATDAEREGELIGAEILEYVGFSRYEKAKRFWISEALTQEVVRKGIEAAKPLLEYASYKTQGYARQQADWLIGMNLTRLVSLKSGKLLTFGRVQTAVLAAVHERENSIENFIPEKYFEVKALLRKSSSLFSVRLVNQDNEEFPFRFKEGEEALKKIETEKASMKEGTIKELKTEKKTVPPPQLFNLTALQKEAHKKHGYSPEETLSIAQALYEKHKCLSYPRTPSVVMGDDDVPLVKSIFDKLSRAYTGTPWEAFITGAGGERIEGSNKRLFNTKELEDHHALIPLSPIPEGADEKEKNVYLLVLRRFFNLLKPPYVYNSLSIEVDIAGFSFRGGGSEVLDSGWKAGEEKDEDEEVEEDFSGLLEGKTYPVSSVSGEERKTEPKKHYTFATLLTLMENPRNEEGKHLTGLGTPATRGSILQKLVDRKYVALKGKNVLVTGDGKFLIENVKKNEGLASFITIPETTKWEEELHSDTAKFLLGIKAFVKAAIKSTEIEQYQEEKESFGKCPLCGGKVYEGKKSYYCSEYKTKPCSFVLWKEIAGARITATDVKALLVGKKTAVKNCVGKSKKEFQVQFTLVDGKTEFFFPDRKK